MIGEGKDGLKRLILCLDPRSASAETRMIIYDHLSLMCAADVSTFNGLVVALDYYKFVKRERVQYYDLIEVLRDDPNPKIKASCLRFINTIVSTPDDLDERMRIRQQMLRMGLRSIITRIHADNPTDMDFAVE